MALVIISKDSSACGTEIAELLAGRLGYTCYSRDAILKACSDFDIPEIRLEKALNDIPSIFDRFTYGKERYISVFRSVLLNNLVQDNAVYHGLAGQFYLREILHACKIRIITDMETRVGERVMLGGCSRLEALTMLEKEDDNRKRWSLGLYGLDITDSRHYDMTLNIGTISIGNAVDLLEQVVKQGQFLATPESTARLLEMALMASIHSDLVEFSPKVVLNYEDGVVTVHNFEGSKLDQVSFKEETTHGLKEKYGIADVIFGEPMKVKRWGTMNFYNLSNGI